MLFANYPYTDLHELNLDWILKIIKELDHEVDDFVAFNKITWAGEWDGNKSYTAWNIVQDGDGNGYLSLRAVPKNVPLSNTEYWQKVADYDALYAAFGQRLDDLEDALPVIDQRLDDLDQDVSDIQDELKKAIKVVTPQMFGAVGDGVTDDYQAFQDALDAVYAYHKEQMIADWWQSGGKLYIPAGKYYLSQPLHLTEGVYIEGESPYSVNLQFAANVQYGITNRYTNEINGYRNVTIKNLSITGSGSYGIYLLRGYDSLVENVNIFGAWTVGYFAQMTVNTICRKMHIYGPTYGINMTVLPGGPNTTTVFDECWIAHCSSHAFMLSSNEAFGNNSVTFKNCIFEYCGSAGVINSELVDSKNIMFIGCYWEQNTNPLSIQATSCIIEDAFFDSTASININVSTIQHGYDFVCVFKNVTGYVNVQTNSRVTVYHENVTTFVNAN